jgi:hypothetical protein
LAREEGAAHHVAMELQRLMKEWSKQFRNIYAEKEAGQPQPYGMSGEAPMELVFQGGEHEGSPEVGDDNSSGRQRQADLCGDADRNKEELEAG